MNSDSYGYYDRPQLGYIKTSNQFVLLSVDQGCCVEMMYTDIVKRAKALDVLEILINKGRIRWDDCNVLLLAASGSFRRSSSITYYVQLVHSSKLTQSEQIEYAQGMMRALEATSYVDEDGKMNFACLSFYQERVEREPYDRYGHHDMLPSNWQHGLDGSNFKTIYEEQEILKIPQAGGGGEMDLDELIKLASTW